MASPKRERKRQRKAAGQPVRIVVCGYPSETLDSITPLLKSAVLYGDEVVLHSPVAASIAAIAAIADSKVDDLIDVILETGPSLGADFRGQLSTLDRQLGSGMGKQVLSQLLEPGSTLRKEIGSLPGGDSLDLDAVDASFSDARADLRRLSEEQLAAAGFPAVAPALEAGIMVIDPFDVTGENGEEAYIGHLQGLLDDPRSYAVFDDRLSAVIRSALREGALDLGDIARGRSTQATTADRLLASLPTFPMARMDEIVDIRDDLKPALVRFRSELISATSDLQATSVDEHFDEAATEFWHARVVPALDELDELTKQSGLLRTYGAEAAAALAIPAATMAVHLATGNLPAAAVTGLGTGQIAVDAMRRGAETRRQRIDARSSNPYCFLHQVDTLLD